MKDNKDATTRGSQDNRSKGRYHPHTLRLGSGHNKTLKGSLPEVEDHNTRIRCGRLPRLSDKVPAESRLADVNAAPHTIPVTKTENNKLPRVACIQDEHYKQ